MSDNTPRWPARGYSSAVQQELQKDAAAAVDALFIGAIHDLRTDEELEALRRWVEAEAWRAYARYGRAQRRGNPR